MSKIDFRNNWDIYIKYFIGFSIIIFCIYILISDITFLAFHKETVTENVIINKKNNTISFVYFNSNKEKKIIFENYKVKDIDSNLLKSGNVLKVYYDPLFSENIYFDSKNFPKIGSLVLFIFGIIIIYIITTHKW